MIPNAARKDRAGRLNDGANRLHAQETMTASPAVSAIGIAMLSRMTPRTFNSFLLFVLQLRNRNQVFSLDTQDHVISTSTREVIDISIFGSSGRKNLTGFQFAMIWVLAVNAPITGPERNGYYLWLVGHHALRLCLLLAKAEENGISRWCTVRSRRRLMTPNLRSDTCSLLAIPSRRALASSSRVLSSLCVILNTISDLGDRPLCSLTGSRYAF